jgi:replicative DNA helicase Mcm
MSEVKTASRIVDELSEILSKREYSDVIDALTPKMSLPFDFTAPEFVELYKQDKGNFFKYVREAIMQRLELRCVGFDARTAFAGLKIEPQGQPAISMQDINPRDNESNIVCFDCQVIAVDKRKSYIKSGTGSCDICGHSETVECDPDLKLKMPKCTSRGCGKALTQLVQNTIKTDYIQNIWMQEPIETAKHNMPVIFIGKLHGSFVGDVFPSQKKRVTGIFKTVIDPKKNEHDIIIDIIYINDLEETDAIKPLDVEVKSLKQKSKEPEFLNKIVDSYAPSIYGHENIKLTCLLYLASGVPGQKRSEINVALFGDPSMAKSEILKFTNKVAFKSKYTSGKGSSGAGLTIGMVKENDSLIPMAGVLPLHTRGFVQIDEFDKMKTEDRSAMHEVMEQGTCSIAKAGVNLTLEAKCSILAAANPKYGRYDEDLTIADNINIPPALLSRFDILWLITDKVNTLQDIAKAQHILKTFRGELKSDEVFMSERDMMAYLNYVRELTPTLDDVVSHKIERFYQKMREMSSSEADSLPVGIRQLEAIIRMSQAHAKLFFRTKVAEDDVKAIFDLLGKSYMSFNKNLTEDNSMQSDITSFSTKKLTKEKTADVVWNSCSDGSKNQNVYMVVFTKELVKTEKFDKTDATKWFNQWEKEGVILKNKNGTYRKA